MTFDELNNKQGAQERRDAVSRRYLSICSGIEAASVAWHDLGFVPVGFSEIEPFPCAVLKHRFPNVPNFGDMTKFKDWNHAHKKPNQGTKKPLESGDSLQIDSGATRQNDAGSEGSLCDLRPADETPCRGSQPRDGRGSGSALPPLQRDIAGGRKQEVGSQSNVVSRPSLNFADVDILVGGTPCQAFSVAGLRRSLDDARGNLSLTYIKLFDYIDENRNAAGRPPAICVWENVPGVLNTKDNAFGCFLGALAGSNGALQPPDPEWGWTDAGYVRGPTRAIAWRCLDAQYFGLAQRRKRVFVVASARNGFCPSQVLFEPESLRGDSAPSRETGQRAAPTISARPTGGGGLGTDFDCDGGLVPSVVGTLSDGAHNGGGSTGKTPTRAESSQPARCLTGSNQRIDAETETLIPCTTNR